jgi:ketosteroid isomerase-like protein
MSQENVEIVRRVFDAFQEGLKRGDFGAGFDLDAIAPDVEWIPAPLPGVAEVYRGREGFIEFMNNWTEDFEAGRPGSTV